MTAALKKDIQRITPLPMPVSIEQFLSWYPDNTEYRYELRRGVIFQTPKLRGKHSRLSGDIAKQLNYAIDGSALPYFVPRECIVKVSNDTGYEPDVIVLDETILSEEPLWEKSSTLQNGESIKLVVEVVSSNWQDDYELKLAAYESIGISEYWIVDYAGLGGVRHIGRPKQPTLTICKLIEGEYEVSRIRANEKVPSELSPEFSSIAEQILSFSSVQG